MSKIEFSIGDIQVCQSGFGIDIKVPYNGDFGIAKNVEVSVRTEGINIAATGTLSDRGQEALQDALALARLIQKYM